ncbi:MAG: hypothetical protein CM1200mP40_27700 [Gammaproteobacteria bacterium]|nr:MAG: hypothetical protein CM1200mP40_27700 [Gammaproteobacteria bacterium]
MDWTNWIQISNKTNQESIVERRGLISDLFKKIKVLNEQSQNLSQNQSQLRSELETKEAERDQLQTDLANKTKHLGEINSEIRLRKRKKRGNI